MAAHHLFNLVPDDAPAGPPLRELAAGLVGAGLWGVDAEERHGAALAPGDLVLLYLGAPERVFVGQAELASAVHDWTSSEAAAIRGETALAVAGS